MLESLLQFDQQLFLFINQSLANPVTDFFMPIITNDMFLRIIYGLALILLLVRGKKPFIWIVVFSLLVVALTDQVSSAWLKPFFERLRPCKELNVHLLVNCGSGYSFPSSHAANLFGQAVFFSLLFPRAKWYWLVFAFLVAISRVFVGVHYPLDITAGAVLGTFIGFVVACMLLHLNQKPWFKPRISV